MEKTQVIYESLCPPNRLEQRKILTPFQRKLLDKALESNLSCRHRRRIRIMLLADEGQSQAQICKTLGCSQETARYWIAMARTGQAQQWQNPPLGRPKTVNREYLERLRELVTRTPKDFNYPFRRWTAQKLSEHLARELGVEISPRHVNRLLKKMGLSTRATPSQLEEIGGQPPTGSRIDIRNLSDCSETEPEGKEFLHTPLEVTQLSERIRGLNALSLSSPSEI